MATTTKNKKSSKKPAKVKKTVSSKKATSVLNSESINMQVEKNTLKSKNVRNLTIAMFIVLLLVTLYLLKGFFVAAMVNGKPISRWALIRELEEKQGQATLDDLVAQELIIQEAAKKNIVVSLEDIKPDLENISTQLEAEGTTLDAALASRGISRSQFEENFRMQKMLEKILADELNVSDEELMKYFEENKEFMGENANYEDLKEDLRLQLKQQKFDLEYQKWYEQAKAESNVIYNISF